jgi:hypothetical protein
MNASTPVAPPKSAAQPSAANIQLLQLTNAFWTSRCLHIVAEIGVADHLDARPQSTAALAKATGSNEEALITSRIKAKPIFPVARGERGEKFIVWN